MGPDSVPPRYPESGSLSALAKPSSNSMAGYSNGSSSAPTTFCEMDIDGEMQIMINIDGLSKMLTTGGVDNLVRELP
jgi:hypothetical protein